ncbi:MAG: hypothetical protein J3K34DRAFT_445007 [Monoraphidium minutum]|nr:MAG: hypothetical protein J3K34DRAFT_445007 [Monoraphidium minutum]
MTKLQCVLAVAALLLATAQAQNYCVVPASLKSSTAQVGGQITQPIAAVVKPGSPASFQGTIGIVFPQSKCPTAGNVQAALKSAFLATPKGWAPVSVTPSTAAVQIGNTQVATVSLTGLQGTVASQPGVQNPKVVATAGVVTTKSQLNMDPFNLAGQAMSMAGSGCGLKASGTQVTFGCPNLQVNNQMKVRQGAGNIQIKGALTAVGDLTKGQLLPASQIPRA